MSDFENRDDPDFRAYAGLRHFSPESVRSMRLSLDVGVAPIQLQSNFRKARVKAKTDVARNVLTCAIAAVPYMVRNPKAGVGWEENGVFNWRGGDQ